MKSPLKFLLHTPVLSPIRLAGWSVLTKVLAQRHMAIVPAGDEPYRMPAYDLIRATRQQTSMVLLDPEAYAIYATALRTQKIPGDIAEVGVYRGGSARLICEVKGDRALHLFDTFAGLPETGPEDSKLFQKGGFASSYAHVEAYLKSFPNVHFHPGLFPDTAKGLEHLRFSFVHLDVDLYRSTASALEWFYPRLQPGAVLISHDYVNADGVRKAFDEFFADKPECLLELAGTQVAFVKV
jgi:O-methyltransferase